MAEVVILPGTPDEAKAAAGELAADLIQKVVVAKADAVLGLATGSTPLTIWRALAARGIDWSRVRGFALDEYIGLPEGHPESYRAVITREVVDTLGLTPNLVHGRAGLGW